MEYILQVKDLKKAFGDLTAVDGVSFTVDPGEVFGLLGPNGAGKSTTISMMCGLLTPTAGDVWIAGNSVRKSPMKVKRDIGVIPQDIALYPTLSARENLHFWGSMYGLPRAEVRKQTETVLEMVGLEDRANQRIDQYSGGMKRRINIAAGLLHRPKVLVMDEPTVGIDPQSRNHILETVKELNRNGMTVIYTSHYMEEVEYLCDRVGIIDHGKIIALGTKEELRQQVGEQDVIHVKAAPISAVTLRALEALPGVSKIKQEEEGVEILAPNGKELLSGIVTTLTKAGAKVTTVDIKEPDLESLFLQLTGRALRD